MLKSKSYLPGDNIKGEVSISTTKDMKSIHVKKYKQIVRLLKQKREQAGITQKQLAQTLHLKQTQISKIETNERRIDLLELVNYLRGIDVPFMDFAAEVSEIVNKK